MLKIQQPAGSHGQGHLRTSDRPRCRATSPCSGDFNGWDASAHPLKKRSNGTRSVSVELPAGEYRFKYCTEAGEWFCDPAVGDVELNEFNTENSVLRV